MINANELRITNKVYDNGKICTIESINAFADGEADVYLVETGNAGMFIDPIPLTDDILSKCGFEVEKSADIYEYDVYSIQISNTRSLCFCKHPLKNSTTGEETINDAWWFDYFYGPSFTNFGNDFWCKIKYLHTLQNLYFALTGEELNIKL